MKRVNELKRIITLTNPYYREREKPMGQDLSIPKSLGNSGANGAPRGSAAAKFRNYEEEDEEYTLQQYQQRRKAVAASHKHYRSDSGYDSSSGKIVIIA